MITCLLLIPKYTCISLFNTISPLVFYLYYKVLYAFLPLYFLAFWECGLLPYNKAAVFSTWKTQLIVIKSSVDEMNITDVRVCAHLIFVYKRAFITNTLVRDICLNVLVVSWCTTSGYVVFDCWVTASFLVHAKNNVSKSASQVLLIILLGKVVMES